MPDIENTYSTIIDGIKNVASAGTAVQIETSSTPVRMVEVQARPENTDVVVVGSSTVVAAAATRRGFALAPGASIRIRIDDVSKLYLDAVVSNEGISYVAFRN